MTDAEAALELLNGDITLAKLFKVEPNPSPKALVPQGENDDPKQTQQPFTQLTPVQSLQFPAVEDEDIENSEGDEDDESSDMEDFIDDVDEEPKVMEEEEEEMDDFMALDNLEDEINRERDRLKANGAIFIDDQASNDANPHLYGEGDNPDNENSEKDQYVPEGKQEIGYPKRRPSLDLDDSEIDPPYQPGRNPTAPIVEISVISDDDLTKEDFIPSTRRIHDDTPLELGSEDELEAVEHYEKKYRHSAKLAAKQQDKKKPEYPFLIPKKKKVVYTKLDITSEMTEKMLAIRTFYGRNMLNLGSQLQDFFGDTTTIHSRLFKHLFKHQLQALHFIWYVVGSEPAVDQVRGALLALDMGLGKTLTTIAFIDTFLNVPTNVDKKILILVPKTLLPNWQKEFEAWCDWINIRVIQPGVPHKKKLEILQQWQDNRDFNILITAHSTWVLLSEKHAAQVPSKVDLLVVDEAHGLKNDEIKLFSCLMNMNIQRRICLTGYPLQNHLVELYHLLRFVDPSFLTLSKQAFDDHFCTPIMNKFSRGLSEEENLLAAQRLGELHDFVEPLLFRIGWDSIQTEKPMKQEICIRTKPSLLQSRLAAQYLSTGSRKVLEKVSELKLIANMPALSYIWDQSRTPRISDSGKMIILQKIVKWCLSHNEKLLVFSDSVRTLHEISLYLTKQSIKCLLLTGHTVDKQREEIVNLFQNSDEPYVLLLSEKVGGIGINLQAASRVVIFDVNWNPCIDAQAVHRVILFFILTKNRFFVGDN